MIQISGSTLSLNSNTQSYIHTVIYAYNSSPSMPAWVSRDPVFKNLGKTRNKTLDNILQYLITEKTVVHLTSHSQPLKTKSITIHMFLYLLISAIRMSQLSSIGLRDTFFHSLECIQQCARIEYVLQLPSCKAVGQLNHFQHFHTTNHIGRDMEFLCSFIDVFVIKFLWYDEFNNT